MQCRAPSEIQEISLLYLNHGQVFALLDRLREVGQHVLADIETGEERQAGHGRGDAAQLIISEIQLLQAVTVKQGPRGEKCICQVSLYPSSLHLLTKRLLWIVVIN